MMIPIQDFQRRSLTGPVMKGDDFDLGFALKLRKLVAKYDIKCDPHQIVVDDATADAVFEAGVELLAEVGLYHRDTQRVAQFTKEEVQLIAREARDGQLEHCIGKGSERVTIHRRTANDPRPPVVLMSTSSIPSNEELYQPWVQSFLQEDLCQGMSGFGTLVAAKGVQNRAGTPGEVACSMAELRYVQAAARRVGKPGLHLGRSSAISAAGVMSLYHPGGLDRDTGMIPIHLMPEQKLDWQKLVLAHYAEQCGITPFTSGISIIGALCRGAVDASVALVANVLGQLGYGHGTIVTLAAVSLDGSGTNRENLWANSAAARAFERHVSVPVGCGGQSVAGAGTEMAVYEKVAHAVAAVSSGTAWLWAMGCRKGQGENVNTGLEGRAVAEAARAVAGMPRQKANDLIDKIISLYESDLSAAPQGKTFPELYDVESVRPTEEYLAVYQRAKERLATLGVPYP